MSTSERALVLTRSSAQGQQLSSVTELPLATNSTSTSGILFITTILFHFTFPA